MKRTLIVGLGGTGIKVGHLLKKKLLDFFDRDELTENGEEKLAFLFIDNDKNEPGRAADLLRGTTYFNPSDFVMIQPFNGLAYHQEIEKAKRSGKVPPKLADCMPWFDSLADFPRGNHEAGMAGNRQLGKLGAFLNHEAIARGIQTRMERLLKVGATSGGRIEATNVAIYIIASICGGTGSSTFLDVAALIDANANFASACQKRAILICPGFFLDRIKHHGKDESHPTYKAYQRNSWAFMAECEYLLKYGGSQGNPALLARHSSRPGAFANRIRAGHGFSPFASAMLLDQETQDGLKIGQDRFFDFISDMVFEVVCGSANERFDSDIVNVPDVADAYRSHKTIAAKTIEFPRADFEAYFASRYLYEVFANVLAKRDFLPGEQESISDAAKSLAANLETILDQRIEDLFRGFASRPEGKRALDLKPPAPQDSYSDKGGILDSGELEALFKEHDRALQEFRQMLVDKVPQGLKEEMAFEKPFDRRNNAADAMRREVFVAVASIVRRLGFHAVVGLSGAEGAWLPGLLRDLIEEVAALQTKLDAELKLVSSATALDREVEAKRDAIRAAAKGKLGWKKKVDDLRTEIEDYHRSLKKWCDESWRRIGLEAQLEILKAFGRTGGGSQPGWLQGYLKRLEDAVLPNVSGRDLPSLSTTFDDGRPDGESIKVAYLEKLRRTFADTQRNIFRTTIPFELHSLVANDSWDADSPLAREYDAAVTVTADEVEAIFTDLEVGEGALGERAELLAFLGERPNEVGKRLDRIKNMVADRFRTHYLASGARLGQFVGRDIVVVWNDLSYDRRNVLKMSLSNPPVPLAFRGGSRPGISGSTYLVLYDDPSFLKLAEDEFQISGANFVSFKKDHLRNRFTFLSILDGINFGDLSGIDLAKLEYENRDLKSDRPHGVAEWNDHKEGPWAKEFEIAAKGSTIEAEVGNTSYKLDGVEILLFCHLLDRVAQNQKAKDLRETLFPSSKARKIHGWEARAPIAFESTRGAFGFWEEHTYESEGKGAPRKFAVVASTWRKLSLSYEGLKFEESLQEFRANNGVIAAVERFFQLVMAKRAAVRKELKTDPAKRAIQKELAAFRKGLRAAEELGANSPLTDGNRHIVEQLPSTTGELLKRLFDVGLF
ncbi:MAG: tubulin-like doman-containing protein [Acidobacteriota bacterium]|nr:tubulin-like doman-containing protein [Acidobacteriota bacterium]